MWAFFAFTLSASTATFLIEGPDVVIATSPPLVVAFPGWLAARLRARRKPLIFEVRDLWPESAVTTGVLSQNSLLTRVLYAVERWIVSAADCVNVLTPAFREDILRRGLAAPEKISFVPNGADLDLFAPDQRETDVREKFGWGDRFVVLYSGAHGKANALHQLVDAASCLQDRPDILIASVGDGPERARLEQDAARRELSNIRFYGAVPKDRMPEIINACDVGAAVLQNNPTFRSVYPNKVFDYMACGKPTLLAIDGVARNLVCDEARAGIYTSPEDGKGLADAIRTLADDPVGRAEMGRRGREWVVANASRRCLAMKYLDLMTSLVSRPGGVLGGSVRPSVSATTYQVLKRVLDVVVSSLALVILSPVLVVTLLTVRLTLGKPALFRQVRIGYGERPFLSYKLRTMTNQRGADCNPLPDEERLTRVGRFLRASSLDELPQLWNVLKGDMSTVGPRPLMEQYLSRYTPRQRQRHQVKPGITGWAQVHGRNALSWEKRFELDVWYVEHCGLWLDVKILAMTIWKVLRREGISQTGHATMSEFLGTQESTEVQGTRS
jgi:lipopolysaccharide/colanic/teichoic acid biosynthesis glycosyltransferase